MIFFQDEEDCEDSRNGYDNNSSESPLKPAVSCPHYSRLKTAIERSAIPSTAIPSTAVIFNSSCLTDCACLIHLSTKCDFSVQANPDAVERFRSISGKATGSFSSGQQRLRFCRNAVAGHRPDEAQLAAKGVS